MPRLLYQGEWFDELSPFALYESEFESLLIQNADVIREGTVIVPFKKLVVSGAEAAKPDLAIVSHDYRDWCVVEVEMVRHDLYGHVLPQVRTMRDGAYGQSHADYMADKNPNLDRGKLRAMMLGERPKVLVIANKPEENWGRELRSNSILLMTLELYKSRTNRYIFSVDGSLPRPAHDVVTSLALDPILPRMLTVASPAALEFGPGVRVPIFVDDLLTEWERIDIADRCYLSPVGKMPIKPGQEYALVKTSAGNFAIRPKR